MKNTFKIFFFLLFLSAIAQAQSLFIPPKVDQRVELLSIVFRLAGIEEYNSQDFTKYVEHIEKHFGAYRKHDLIKYIKLIREENGIAYDAVMSMATSITEPPNMKPIVPFSNSIPEKRWGKETASEFLRLLNEFYKDADCAAFFKQHTEMYQLSSKEFEKSYEGLNFKWYKNFYGQNPKGEYRTIIAAGNGGFNYGARIVMPGNTEVIYSIVGINEFDDLGMPVYEHDAYFSTILHEFNHSFINHLIENFESKFQKSGEIIYKHLGSKMRKQKYNSWQTMYSEALVRASVIKYMKDNHFSEALVDEEITEQFQRGFLWTENLVKELERYDNNREKYPTLEAFIPEIVEFFNQVAPIIDEKTPKVISMEPAINHSADVDHAIKKITVNFDQELLGHGYSFNPGIKGKEAFPEFENVVYSNDKKSVTFEVSLEPDKEYQFVLTGMAFKTKENYELADFVVTFKTNK
jgi:hypothetical protein